MAAERGQFPCFFCGRSFDEWSSIRKHTRSHYGKLTGPRIDVTDLHHDGAELRRVMMTELEHPRRRRQLDSHDRRRYQRNFKNVVDLYSSDVVRAHCSGTATDAADGGRRTGVRPRTSWGQAREPTLECWASRRLPSERSCRARGDLHLKERQEGEEGKEESGEKERAMEGERIEESHEACKALGVTERRATIVKGNSSKVVKGKEEGDNVNKDKRKEDTEIEGKKQDNVDQNTDREGQGNGKYDKLGQDKGKEDNVSQDKNKQDKIGQDTGKEDTVGQDKVNQCKGKEVKICQDKGKVMGQDNVIEDNDNDVTRENTAEVKGEGNSRIERSVERKYINAKREYIGVCSIGKGEDAALEEKERRGGKKRHKEEEESFMIEKALNAEEKRLNTNRQDTEEGKRLGGLRRQEERRTGGKKDDRGKDRRKAAVELRLAGSGGRWQTRCVSWQSFQRSEITTLYQSRTERPSKLLYSVTSSDELQRRRPRDHDHDELAYVSRWQSRGYESGDGMPEMDIPGRRINSSPACLPRSKRWKGGDGSSSVSRDLPPEYQSPTPPRWKESREATSSGASYKRHGQPSTAERRWDETAWRLPSPATRRRGDATAWCPLPPTSRRRDEPTWLPASPNSRRRDEPTWLPASPNSRRRDEPTWLPASPTSRRRDQPMWRPPSPTARRGDEIRWSPRSLSTRQEANETRWSPPSSTARPGGNETWWSPRSPTMKPVNDARWSPHSPVARRGDGTRCSGGSPSVRKYEAKWSLQKSRRSKYPRSSLLRTPPPPPPCPTKLLSAAAASILTKTSSDDYDVGTVASRGHCTEILICKLCKKKFTSRNSLLRHTEREQMKRNKRHIASRRDRRKKNGARTHRGSDDTDRSGTISNNSSSNESGSESGDETQSTSSPQSEKQKESDSTTAQLTEKAEVSEASGSDSDTTDSSDSTQSGTSDDASEASSKMVRLTKVEAIDSCADRAQDPPEVYRSSANEEVSETNLNENTGEKGKRRPEKLIPRSVVQRREHICHKCGLTFFNPHRLKMHVIDIACTGGDATKRTARTRQLWDGKTCATKDFAEDLLDLQHKLQTIHKNDKEPHVIEESDLRTKIDLNRDGTRTTQHYKRSISLRSKMDRTRNLLMQADTRDVIIKSAVADTPVPEGKDLGCLVKGRKTFHCKYCPYACLQNRLLLLHVSKQHTTFGSSKTFKRGNSAT